MKNILLLLTFLLVTSIQLTAQWFWQNPLPQGNTLYDLKFISSQLGWTVGDGGTILKTIDGGTTWMLQESGTNQVLYSVALMDTSNLVAVGGFGAVLKTTDGGTT